MIAADQIKAARKLLGWMPSRIAEMAKLHTAAINRAERSGIASLSYLMLIQGVLEAAGIEFGDAGQVTLKAWRA